MKESLVKQAARAHWSESTYKEDAELAYDDCDCLSVIALAKSIALRAFEKGAEWQTKQSPWISVKDKLPPYNKKVLLLNIRNEVIRSQIFNDGYDIKTYCDWYCISYWMLANFPE